MCASRCAPLFRAGAVLALCAALVATCQRCLATEPAGTLTPTLTLASLATCLTAATPPPPRLSPPPRPAPPRRASENASLVTLPPWSNPWLLAAIGTSVALHLAILYTPPLAAMFR